MPAQILRPAVGALVACVTAEVVEVPSEDRHTLLEQTTREVTRKLQNMPRHLSAPMQGMTLVFDWAGLLTTGKPFHRQSPTQQVRQLKAWKNGPIGVLRTFVDFYEKMGTFVYCSTIEEREQVQE